MRIRQILVGDLLRIYKITQKNISDYNNNLFINKNNILLVLFRIKFVKNMK